MPFLRTSYEKFVTSACFPPVFSASQSLSLCMYVSLHLSLLLSLFISPSLRLNVL